MNKNQAQKIQQIADCFKSQSKPEPTSKPIGRPKTGKSSNPDFKAVTVYIRLETQNQINHLKLDLPEHLDFSDITQIALDQWLDRQKVTLSPDSPFDIPKG